MHFDLFWEQRVGGSNPSAPTIGRSLAFARDFACGLKRPQDGWAANGNLLAYSDSVMGDLAFQYDTLNRLTSMAHAGNASDDLETDPGLVCYAYDASATALP
jgi:YD repeat-containing protein